MNKVLICIYYINLLASDSISIKTNVDQINLELNPLVFGNNQPAEFLGKDSIDDNQILLSFFNSNINTSLKELTLKQWYHKNYLLILQKIELFFKYSNKNINELPFRIDKEKGILIFKNTKNKWAMWNLNNKKLISYNLNYNDIYTSVHKSKNKVIEEKIDSTQTLIDKNSEKELNISKTHEPKILLCEAIKKLLENDEIRIQDFLEIKNKAISAINGKLIKLNTQLIDERLKATQSNIYSLYRSQNI